MASSDSQTMGWSLSKLSLSIAEHGGLLRDVGYWCETTLHKEPPSLEAEDFLKSLGRQHFLKKGMEQLCSPLPGWDLHPD